MQKNEIAIVTIEDIGVNGEGIGKVDGYTLFIKDAIIGDVVEAKVMKAKKNYGYARLMKVITPSEYRVEPKCAFARRCGGCQIQEMSYEKQLEFKQNKVRGNLERIGGFAPEFLEETMEPIVGMEEPFYYRNKAQFPFGTDKEGNPVTGFYAGRTHDIIANTDCALGVPVNREILEIVLEHMKKYQIPSYDETTGEGLIRHVLIRFGFTTKEIMVCFVVKKDTVEKKGNRQSNQSAVAEENNGIQSVCSEWIPHQDKLIKKLCEIDGMTSITVSPNTKRNNVIMGDTYQVIWGQGYITDYIGDIKYQISPLSFYQVNPVQTEKLYGLALKYAGLENLNSEREQTEREAERESAARGSSIAGDKEPEREKTVVWDLYCGIGTISLFLAQQAGQVYGVEIIPQAIEDAKQNAKINGIENAEFYVGKAEEVLPAYYKNYAKEHLGETAHADVIVVDPPRKGCEESLLKTMLDMKPERIVYVSCDSATLARDLKYLCGSGEYEMRKWRAVDQFPMSVHVETAVKLVRKTPDAYIDITVDMDELDLTASEAKATYQEIKDYIKEKYDVKVSSLYIAQIKQKHGIIERENYNTAKSENAKQPQCPPEKETLIEEALRHFKMIS